MEEYHIPVMLDEVLYGLDIKPDGIYVDCTLGGGGHSLEIAKALSKNGLLISLDQDDDSLSHVRDLQKTEKYNAKWELVKSNFSKLSDVLKSLKIEKVDGILFDLGVSSYQFDTVERGFSFRGDAELDMRMDKDLAVKAADLVNGLYVNELAKLLFTYGEEPFAKRIARAIVETREKEKITTTKQLLSVIQKVVPFRVRKKTSMRVFQAFRIAVNDEIGNLQKGLPQALESLARGGKCAVIAFHSLEDRVVKETFLDYEKREIGQRVNKKPILPTENEIRNNTRARSAKLRIFEKQ